jgi:N-sulfoglucosamine sulfohydrolase
MHISLLKFIAISGLLTLWVGAAERNVIVIITDDESPTLGCYGDPVAVTPHVDSLAEDGIRFDFAYATAASCSASRSAVLSGLYNHRNGQYGHTHEEHHFQSFESIEPLTMPRALSRAGYRTGHVGKLHVAPEKTYRFDNYFRADERNAVEMAEAVVDFIAEDSDRPFLLYFAPGDPHRGGGFDEGYEGAFKPDLFGNPKSGESKPGVEDIVFDPREVPIPPFLPDTKEVRAELAQYYQSCARVDQGVGILLAALKEHGLYDKTLIVFTSDHGMAFPGAKTTVYEAGLSVPLVVRNPYAKARGVVTEALVSLVDLTPTLLDFAGALDREHNRPAGWTPPPAPSPDPTGLLPNLGYGSYDSYQGRSWMPIFEDPKAAVNPYLLGSHTFHEIQMYYPMRAVWDRHYKLIHNLNHQIPFPMASDLLASSTWKRQLENGADATLGRFSVDTFLHRPEFELYDLSASRFEQRNLAEDPEHAAVFKRYKALLRRIQAETGDPWLQ